MKRSQELSAALSTVRGLPGSLPSPVGHDRQRDAGATQKLQGLAGTSVRGLYVSVAHAPVDHLLAAASLGSFQFDLWLTMNIPRPSGDFIGVVV